MNYIEDYYTKYDEENRLARRYGMPEYITTMKYIHQCLENLDRDTARILEVGAGTGRYSISLAREGYQVDAIELVEHNLNQLIAKTHPTDRICAQQGNALDLSRYAEDTFDVTLLLGPMYHLYTKEDMQKALSEAVRVTKKGGCIFVAYCMNEATFIQYGVWGKRLMELKEKKMLTPEFQCISKPEDLFVMLRLEEINQLNESVDVSRIRIVAADGATGYIRPVIDEMTEEEFQMFLEYHLATCERMDLIGASNHSLDILRKGKKREEKE